MTTMQDNYKGSLTLDERQTIDVHQHIGESVRQTAKVLDLPYGKVRGYVEWADSSLPDLIPPPLEGPRILIFDIENTAAEGKFFGKPFKTRILKVTRDWFLLCAAYKWLGQDEIGWFGLPDDPQWQGGDTNDSYVAKRLWKLLDQADIVIAHNGENFDTKKCNTRFSVLRMGPPSPYQQVDTLKEDRRYFNRTSHSLKDVATALGLTDKISNSGYDLWEQCEAGDVDGWLEMKDYNIQDVGTLEELYLEQLAWIGAPGKKSHPNLGHWSSSEEPVCPNCGSDRLQRRGMYRTAFSEWPTYQCKNCGSYHRDRKRDEQRTDADKVHLV